MKVNDEGRPIDSEAEFACPFKDGDLLKFVRGGHRGVVVRVDARSSFWSREWRYNSDPKEKLNPASWQIVLDVECPARCEAHGIRDCECDEDPGTEWLYMIRESATEIARWCEPVV